MNWASNTFKPVIFQSKQALEKWREEKAKTPEPALKEAEKGKCHLLFVTQLVLYWRLVIGKV
ncbi:MAG: hypothetical protein LBR26_07885 [Prevotella sp.]|jgi:hypothetical protein|nr:hypothetical protein [Prevotella sp.]